MPFSFIVPFIAAAKSGPHSYHPLPAPDDETLLPSPESKEARILPFKYSLILDPSFWLTTFAVLSVAVTIWNLLVIQRCSQEPHVTYLEASIGSPYNGLGRLVRNDSSPSWPLSSIHYPDFMAATDGTYVRHALSNGSIVRLDSERTIIIQHRVRDYGLEHCTVKLVVSHSTGSRHADTAREYGHVGERQYLTLWRLEDMGGEAVLASSALPMSLSSRKEFLGNMILDGMRPVESPSFACNMGSIQTLEIAVACASDPCIMEFRLTQSPRQGFWVVQSEQKSISA